MQNGAWRFRANRIRNDLSNRKIDSLVEFVMEKLITETTIQFLAGDDYLPAMDHAEVDDFLVILNEQPFTTGHFRGVDFTTDTPIFLFVMGMDHDDIMKHMQREISKMSNDGLFPELKIITQSND
jgi:hypothetical protein